MQIPILSGIAADGTPDFRVDLPINMVPVPLGTGISQGYLRPASGIVQFGANAELGADRGGINWDGLLFRVLGATLVSINAAGVVTEIGNVGVGGTVSMAYSFDRLAIWSAGRLFYWDRSTMVEVIDPDLGFVIDGIWIAGYFLSTDGTSLIVTELSDPTVVSPLKYGSAESDPDPVKAVDTLHNEVYALGRYTIEAYQNVGGDGFPFQRVDGAQVQKGVIGTHAYARFVDTFGFVGSGRDEAPSVYLMTSGDAAKIATREIETVLQGYPEIVLAQCFVEAQIDKAHQFLYIHLPDRTLVYDHAASRAMGQSIWHIRTSSVVGMSKYRLQHLVRCYDRWIGGDTTSALLGSFDDSLSSHFGAVVGWRASAPILYADGGDAIIHELELVCLTGSVDAAADPVIWASHSFDGETWSQERPVKAGRQGYRAKRICWRNQGTLRHWRVQRFRGTSEAHLSIARLEAQVERLFNK